MPPSIVGGGRPRAARVDRASHPGPRRANARQTNILWAHHDDPSLTLAPAPPRPPRGTQDNPQFFVNPLQFEIQYECLQNLANGACTPPSVSPALPDGRTTPVARLFSRF